MVGLGRSPLSARSQRGRGNGEELRRLDQQDAVARENIDGDMSVVRIDRSRSREDMGRGHRRCVRPDHPDRSRWEGDCRYVLGILRVVN